MSRGGSRLWQKLGLTNNLISIWSEDEPNLGLNDSNIKSITINRGSGVVGEQDHTLELDTTATRRRMTGAALHCDLTNHGMNRLSDLIGADVHIRPRYFGRIGRQEMIDEGGKGVMKLAQKFYCSKWQSQLKESDRMGNQIDGQAVKYLFDHFMNPTDPRLARTPAPQFPTDTLSYGVMKNSYDLGEAKLTYSDFSNKYFSEPGYYVQNTRTGADRVLTLKYRWEHALDRLETWLPLTRSAVLSPAKWEQPNENHASNHKVSWLEPDGLHVAIMGPDSNDVRIPIVEHDLSYIRWNNNYQPAHLGYMSYAAERDDVGWQIPTVDIDLLRLINSPNSSHRIQAVQLLQMEMGDPVFFSGDWYYAFGGIQFATGITERITPNEWTLSLSLAPSLEVVGEWPPTIPAKTWESATYPWNDPDIPNQKWSQM